MEKENHDPIKAFGVMIPKIPSLIIRFGGTFLRFKKDAKKAGKIFKKELLNQGIDKVTADKLTDVYIKGSHLNNFFSAFRHD